MDINFLALSGLSNLIISSILGVLTFIIIYKHFDGLSFFLFNFGIAIFSCGYYFMQISSNSAEGLYWFKILLAGAIVIQPAYLLLVFSLLKKIKEQKIVLITFAILSLLFLVMNFTGMMYTQVEQRFGFGYWPIPKLSFSLFVLSWNLSCIYGFYWLIRGVKENTGLKREQLKYVSTALLVGYIGGATNYPVCYGIPLPPYLNILITFYMPIISYVLIKLRLVDITLTIRYWMIYMLYGVIANIPIIVIAYLLRDKINSIYFLPILTVFSPFLYNKLKHKIYNVVDKLKAFNQYKVQREKLEEWSDMMFEGDTVYQCSKNFAAVLNERFNPYKIGIYIKETKNNKEIYKPQIVEKNIVSGDEFIEIGEEKEVELLKRGQILIREELENYGSSQNEQELGYYMKCLNYEVYYPIMIKKSLFAVVALGSKSEGKMYNDLDYSDLGILIQIYGNALRGLLYQKKMQQFTSMWAHDLNTPFSKGNVMGYLKMAINEKFGSITDELKEILIHVYDCLIFPAENIQKLFMPDSAFKKQKLDFKKNF